jgi:Ser/Thr protein kinase RdoA (MazF antagonist)
MEEAIRERYNEDILQEAMRRYGIGRDQIRLLDGFESFMFEFQRDGCERILRLSHSIRRSVNLIHGEVDWLNYLYEGGVGVARAVPSIGGELVEVIPDGRDGQFLATAFIKAAGGPAWEDDKWNEGLFERYGRLLGRMHRLSKVYEPANPAWRRPKWDNDVHRDVFDWIPDSQTEVRERAAAVLSYIRSLPKDDDSYGLIHQDVHGGNFFVDDNGDIMLFDFDDCVYGWYVYDIAMVVFYMVTNHPDPVGLATAFWPHFWRGYQQENDLDPAWLAEMPAFFKLREVDLYGIIHRSFDVENVTDEWAAQFMDGRRQRIEQDNPYIDIDFTRLA